MLGSALFEASADAIWKVTFHKERRAVELYLEKLKNGPDDRRVLHRLDEIDGVPVVVGMTTEEQARVKISPEAAEASGLKGEVIAVLKEGHKIDALPIDVRNVAERLVSKLEGESWSDRQRKLNNEERRLQRGIRGTKTKPGMLSDLVDLDGFGQPVKPYRFILPEQYQADEDVED